MFINVFYIFISCGYYLAYVKRTTYYCISKYYSVDTNLNVYYTYILQQILYAVLNCSGECFFSFIVFFFPPGTKRSV